MSDMALLDFHTEFFQQVQNAARADGRFAEDAFFDTFCAYLMEASELESADRAQYLAPGGVRVDGYGGDPLLLDGVLTLIVADFHQANELVTLTATDMEKIFRRSENFLRKSLKSSFRNGLEETSAGFGLADLIGSRWSQIYKVRLILISNRVLSSRVDGRHEGDCKGTPIVSSVWDISRLKRFVEAGQEGEPLTVDLAAEFGGALPALPAHLSDAGYEAYLLVVPGTVLASIYDRWGTRLLEQNVRVFLQARGKVNRGIRNTIDNEAEMFFAYNNGITATAEGVDIAVVDGVLKITRIHNLQIVNGGQTTASIYTASRKKEHHLKRVFVQMKLSIVEPERAMEVVPRISEYANTQNRVSAADFFSNHPFHVRMENFSRRILAPAADGSFNQSKWFYERARGQYRDARGNLTSAQRKKFDLEYPRAQVFAKTDLAKFSMVWLGNPDQVSKGAQKNFAAFASLVGKDWSKNANRINERYYQHAIAKAIIFRQTEKLVTAQPWYQGGYRANIVAYAIAKIAHDVRARGKAVDFDAVWRAQALSLPFQDALIKAAEAVDSVISSPPSEMRNVTEWAKKQACWDRVQRLKVEWSRRWLVGLVSLTKQKAEARSAVRSQRELNGLEAMKLVVSAGGAVWAEVLRWGLEKRLLTLKEKDILVIAAAIPDRIPSDKQSLVIVETLRKLHTEGCQIGKDLL